jgi:adenine-specific DNA methylase
MESWDKLPLDLMDYFAERETYSRDSYRPIYSIHKWWARRPGSTFRMLGLACLSDDTTTQSDLLRETANGNFEGEYFHDHSEEFSDKTVLDPFVGGGTTLFEINRLGAETIGNEINPVAWWTTKKSIEEVDNHKFKEKYQEVLSDVRDEIGQLYDTIDKSRDNKEEILYAFQTQKVDCLTCDEEVELLPRYVLGKKQANSPAFVFCPNQECPDRIIELDREIGSKEEGDEIELDSGEVVEYSEDGNEICHTCGCEFSPSDGNAGRGKYTCSNGHKHDAREAMQRLDETPTFDYFAIYYKRPDGTKVFKEPSEFDRERIDEVEDYYEENKDELVLPNQSLPEGEEVQRLKNYNYSEFRELFTKRHLVTFGKLFQRASEIEDKNIREFVITALSNSLEYNGKLVRWNPRYRSGHVFETHSYVPRFQPIEGNPLNHEHTANAVENFFEKVYDAKEYCERPYEKVKNTKTGDLDEHYIQGETVTEDSLLSLSCSTSERLELDDGSVDYVITDPPYYGNVQYSELSDYFYVWLREALKEDYPQFESDLVPKARELVANRQAGGKGEDFFIEGLSNVFSECHRVLDDDGEMVFTYHHNENEAWSVILEAIIQSGFTVAGAYPVQSELPTSANIRELDNAEYDILIFANKDETDEELTISELQDDLYFEIQDMIEEERKRHSNLSPADLGVVLRGKCMYYYSKHYPNVFSEGEQVTVEEALDTVDSVIEQVIEGTVDLPPSIDQLSRSYAGLVDRGPESYDDLNKQLMSKGLNVRDLEEEQLVEGPRKQKQPVPGEDRTDHIENKLKGHGPGNNGEDLLDIDEVHYLAHLYRTEQNTIEYLKAWKSDDLEELAEHISDATGDDTYERVMEMNLMQF